MAFEADIVVLDMKYPLGGTQEQIEHFNANVVRGVNAALKMCGLYIEKLVDRDEYEQNMKSKEVNRYIMIKNKDMEEMHLVGSSVYDGFDQFASARYASCSISAFRDMTVIRCRFHPVLYKISKEVNNLLSYMGQSFSFMTNKDVMVFRATSASRNADVFQLFMEGQEKWNASGKGALTDIKNTYGLDINELMTNVDTNIGIYYAPIDYAYALRLQKESRSRHKKFLAHIETLRSQGEQEKKLIEMIKSFEQHNKQELSTADNRVSYISSVLHMAPIGDIKFMRLEKYDDVRKRSILGEEYEFGRRLPK